MTYFSENANQVKQFSRSADNDHTHILHNIPLQAWNFITISIHDKTLDLYLNGKLARTFITPEELQPYDNAGFITLGSLDDEPILSGFISRFNYYPRVLSPGEIYSAYLKGPAKSSDLSDKPDIEKINLNISLDESPTCATAI